MLIWPLREYWFRTNPTLFDKEGCVCGIFLIMRQTLLHLVLGICHHKLICGCVLHRSGSLICDIYRHYLFLCYPSTMRVGMEVIICYFMEADSSLHVWLRGRDVRCLILKVSSFDLLIRVIYLLFWSYMLLAPIWSWGVLEFVWKFVLRIWISKFMCEWKIHWNTVFMYLECLICTEVRSTCECFTNTTKLLEPSVSPRSQPTQWSFFDP